MKFYIILIALFFCNTVFGQFKLAGKISNYTTGAKLQINIPTVYGFYEQNSINVPVAKNGTFKLTIPVGNQRFASLMYQGNIYSLLLKSGKNLTIELDAANRTNKFIGGSAMPENALIDKIKLTESAAFLMDDKYAHLDYNGLNNQLLKPYFAGRDRKIAIVNQSDIAAEDKKLIAAEVKAIAYNNLHELTDIGAENPAVYNKFVADIYAKANVKPDVLPIGPQYYLFANNYLQEVEKKTSGKAGTPIIRLQNAFKYLPVAVAEQYGYQLVLRAFYNGDAGEIKVLSAAYLTKFPAGVYSADVKKKAAKIK